ncbi:integrase core domain-containing protein [Actinosynnema sp. NPDC023794]
MNAIMERWICSCRHELLDRTLIRNQQRLLHALRQYEHFYNTHRPHQGIANARPLQPLPQPTTDHRPPTKQRSPDSTSADGNDSAASSTSTSTQHDLHGRHSRQAQRRLGLAAADRPRWRASARSQPPPAPSTRPTRR